MSNGNDSLAPVRMGDPFIYTDQNTYYLTGTTASNSGFKYYTSTDLKNWREAGWLYRNTPEGWAANCFWAPEVKWYNGLFYLIYSAKDRATGDMLIALAASESPGGPFVDVHAPWFHFGYAAIDGHLFVDDDGAVYVYFSRNGFDPISRICYGINYGVAFSPDLSRPLGEPVRLIEADTPWETVLPDNRCNEGAFVFKANGRYYLTYSANNTNNAQYGIGYATADHPLGPWTKASENPILCTDLSRRLSGPGHNACFTPIGSPQWHMVFHSHDDPANPTGPRVVNIAPLTLNASGALTIGAYDRLVDLSNR